MANKKQTSAKSKNLVDVKKKEAVNTPEAGKVITESQEANPGDSETPIVDESKGGEPLIIKESKEATVSADDSNDSTNDENLSGSAPVTEDEIGIAKKKVAKALAKVKKAQNANDLLKNEELMLEALEEGKPKPFYENEKKRKFRFSKTAPKTMNLQGKNYSQEEIINTAELMDVLIDGNSSFVEPIY